jgi:hypothetical protein
LYSSPKRFEVRILKSRKAKKWRASCTVHLGENTYKGLVGKLKEKKQLGKTNVRYEDNIKMDLKEIKFPGVNWIYMVPNVTQWADCVNMATGIRLL